MKESFLNFFPLRGKTAAEISRSILDELEVNDLDVIMCRGQGYDNASTMSGIHSGVQQTIKNINPKALFVPCENHTLNLAGVHAIGSSRLSERFFAVLERLYAFFAASPYRWGVLLKHAPITLKRVIDTRWSAHRAAVNALHTDFDEIMDALEELCNPSENLNTRGDAHGIQEAIQIFTFFSFLCFWKVILRESHDAQTYLQQKGLLLEQFSNKMKAFFHFLVQERDNLVKDSVEAAIKKCTELEIPIEDRIVRRRRRMPGEHAKDAGLSIVEEVRRCMFQALDRFKREADTRFTSIHRLNDMFGFLNPHTLLQSESHKVFSDAFKITYDDEVDFSELAVEIDRFKRLVLSSETTFDRNATAFDVLQWLVKSCLLDSTPYLCLCLKLYLTIGVSIASCERSFSKLKMIKSYLRSTMSDDRLSALSILSVERDYVQQLDFEDIVADFSSAKLGKFNFDAAIDFLFAKYNCLPFFVVS